MKLVKKVIKTNKDRCGAVKHFNSKCKNNRNAFQFLPVQIINDTDIQNYFMAQGKILTKPVIYYDSWHEQVD